MVKAKYLQCKHACNDIRVTFRTNNRPVRQGCLIPKGASDRFELTNALCMYGTVYMHGISTFRV